MIGKKQFAAMVMVAVAPFPAMADENSEYRVEMQQKMQSMTSEERQLYRNMNSESRSSERQGNRYGSGSVDGFGQQKRYRNGGKANGPQDGSGNRYGAQGGGSHSGGYGRGGGGRR